MGTITEELARVNFADFIRALGEGGWFEFVFPFLLVYAIVLTILGHVEIFKERKAVRVIIALVFALFAIAFPITGDLSCGINSGYNYAGNGCETLGTLLTSLFPGVTAFSMGVLGLYIVVAMLGVDLTKFFGKDAQNNKILMYILGGLGLFVVVYYYARGFGWQGFAGDNWLWGDNGLLFDPFLYILIIGALVFVWITKDDDENSGGKNKKVTKVTQEDV